MSEEALKAPKHPLRIIYAAGETFKDKNRSFLWRQVVHQLTSDISHCYFPENYVAVLKIVRIIRSKRLFMENTELANMQYEVPVLLRLLSLHCLCVPLVLILDECQYAGDRDWTLIQSVSNALVEQESLKCVFIVGTRPMHQAKHQPNFRSASPAYFSVLTMLTTEYLHIPNMQRRDTEKLLELELDVTKIPSSFQKLVHCMSGGNPLFTKKFVQGLLFMGLLKVEEEVAHADPPAGTLDNSPLACPRKERTLKVNITSTMFLPVPYKIQRIIATDINRLSVDATVALKCASVLCVGGGHTSTEFDIGMLAIVYPHDGGRAMSSKDLEPHLDTLVQFAMIRTGTRSKRNSASDSGRGSRRFQFMSGMLRDVVYHSTLYAQRRRLHRAAALALESVEAKTLMVDSLFLSSKQRYQHLYRHLALSGQRERAGEVFDMRFGGGRQTREPSIVTMPSSPQGSRKGSAGAVWQAPSPSTSHRTLAGMQSPVGGERFKGGDGEPGATHEGFGLGDSSRGVSMLHRRKSGGLPLKRGSPTAVEGGGGLPPLGAGDNNWDGRGPPGLRPRKTSRDFSGVSISKSGLVTTSLGSTEGPRVGVPASTWADEPHGAGSLLREVHAMRLSHASGSGSFVLNPQLVGTGDGNDSMPPRSRLDSRTSSESSAELSLYDSDCGGGLSTPVITENTGRTPGRVRRDLRRSMSPRALAPERVSFMKRIARWFVCGRSAAGDAISDADSDYDDNVHLTVGLAPLSGSGIASPGAVTAEGLSEPGVGVGTLQLATSPTLRQAPTLPRGPVIVPPLNLSEMERRKEDLQRASFEINRAPFVHVDSGLHTGLHSAGLGRRPKPIPEAGDKPVLGKVDLERGFMSAPNTSRGSESKPLPALIPEPTEGCGTTLAGHDASSSELERPTSSRRRTSFMQHFSKSSLPPVSEGPTKRMARWNSVDRLSLLATGPGAALLPFASHSNLSNISNTGGPPLTASIQLVRRRSHNSVLRTASTTRVDVIHEESSDHGVPDATPLGRHLSAQASDESGAEGGAGEGFLEGIELHEQDLFKRSLQLVDTWDFDIFLVERISKGQALQHVAQLLFSKRRLEHRLDLSGGALSRYVVAIQNGYSSSNPYTNSTHAADVMQTAHIMLDCPEVALSNCVDALDELAVLVAAMVHDFKHPGVTVQFLINANDSLVHTYGLEHPLESYHVAEAFMLLQGDQDFTCAMVPSDRTRFRELVTRLVLATSLTSHFDFVEAVSSISDEDLTVRNQKQLSLELIVRAADVSNCSKPFGVSKQWFNRLTAEFFQQGDRERESGMPVSWFMDRESPCVAECQINFMVYIAVPILSAAARLFPTFRDMFEAGLDENKRFWENEERREQPKMETIVDAVTVVTYVSSDDESEVSFDSLSSDTHALSALALHSLREDGGGVQQVLSPHSDAGTVTSSPVSRKDQSALVRSFIGTAGGSFGGGGGAGVGLGAGFGARRRSRSGSLAGTLTRQSTMPSGKQRLAFGPSEVFASPKQRGRKSGLGSDFESSASMLQRKGSRRVRLLLARAFM